jgi:hypothetical protein
MDIDYYTAGEKEFLLKIARQTLERFLLAGEKFEPQTVNKKLWERNGVFVTLNKNGKLRGCMGSVEPKESLIISIRDNALSVANDPRFDPLGANELDSIDIEISVLSEPQRVDLSGINSGDGVLVVKGDKSATYLPHVWKSFNTKNEFINSLYEKAGINSSVDDLEIEYWIYSAITFKG